MKPVARALFLLMCAAPVFGEEAVRPDDGMAPVTPAAAGAAPTTTVTPIDAADPAPTDAAEAASPADASAPPSPAVPAASDGGLYRVVKGDTLWNIAGLHLKDPFQWTKIWEANKAAIANPDLIYPDQEFVIPSAAAAEALAAAAPAPAPEAPAAEPASEPAAEPAAGPVEEAAAEAPAPAPAPAAKTPTPAAEEAAPVVEEAAVPDVPVRKGTVPRAGFMGGTADAFVAGPDWEYDGYILRDREQKLMISQGDVVFLNVGAASGVQPRMTANVYRLGKKIRDPILRKNTGKLVKRVGTVMITSQVADEACTAVVVDSLEPIRVGDMIKFATTR